MRIAFRFGPYKATKQNKNVLCSHCFLAHKRGHKNIRVLTGRDGDDSSKFASCMLKMVP